VKQEAAVQSTTIRQSSHLREIYEHGTSNSDHQPGNAARVIGKVLSGSETLKGVVRILHRVEARREARNARAIDIDADPGGISR
jgi:hypothetical protein